MDLKLSNGKYTIIDDNMYDKVSMYNWRQDKLANHIVTTIGPPSKRRLLRLHRLVIGAQKGELVDHINGDVTDNRLENLRLATKSTNGMNRKKQNNNKSGYKGVSWSKVMKKWCSQLTKNGERKLQSYHETKEEAAKAYDIAAKLHHGDFAQLNFPIE